MKSVTGMTGIPDGDLLSAQLSQRIVTVGRQIDDAMAGMVSMQLRYLDALDPTAPIHLYIDTPGGCVYHGLHIYDAMQQLQAPVRTYCYGMAMSMGAVLLAAGEAGQRFITPNSTVMIHQVSGVTRGRLSEVDVHLAESRRLNEAVCGILARHTRRSPTQLLEVMRHDRFFGAEAARDFGLVDEVLYPRHRNLAAPAPGQDQAPGRSRKRVRGSERGVILPGE